MKRILKSIFAVAAILLLPISSFAGEEDVRMLKERIEMLEKRSDDLEKELRQEHKPLLKEMSEHISSMERDLDMVDYRTARIKALTEKTEAFSIGGDLSLFLQGIGSNSQDFGTKADVSYSGDLFLIAPVGPYGNIYFRGDIGQGEGIAPSLPNTFSGPNADLEFNEPKFDVAEAWYFTEFPFPDVRDKRLELTVGKIDPTGLFDANAAANSETNQFIADIFVNNAAIEFGGDANGYGAGISAAYRFTSIYNKGLNVSGRIGMFEGDGDFKDALDNPFLIGELGIRMPYYGLIGNYRFYVWQNRTAHTDLMDSSKNDLVNQGLGFSLDQQVSSNMTLFARYGIQDKDVSRNDYVFSLGGQIIGNNWKRGNDVLGFAYGASHVNSKYRDVSSTLDGYEADTEYEHYMEAYYKYWANKNLTVSSDFQYIANPGGDSRKNSIFIYGIRMQVTF